MDPLDEDMRNAFDSVPTATVTLQRSSASVPPETIQTVESPPLLLLYKSNLQVSDNTRGEFKYNASTRYCSVLVMGDARVGKSSLCSVLRDGRMSDSYVATQTADFVLFRESFVPKNCTFVLCCYV